MNLRSLKIAISFVCAAFAAVHLFAPGLSIDGIILGLIAIGLLPWFQPLVKSLELPGGLKVELQDVKAATEKIAPLVDVQPFTEEKKLLVATTEPVAFIRQVSEQDPNLALVSLRIEVEKLLREIAASAGIAVDQRGVGALASELRKHAVIPEVVATGLMEFVSLGNQAAHGARVSRDAADWTLARAPQLLGFLHGLRAKSRQTATLRDEVPKAEVLAAFEKKVPIKVQYSKPFAITPHVTIGFYDSQGKDLSSGSLHVTGADHYGFVVEVVSLPDYQSVTSWAVKWNAEGPST